MSINLFQTPGSIQQGIAKRFKTTRLQQGHSRSKAAQLTAVPAATIKRFETHAEISLRQLLMLSHVYGDLNSYNAIFPEQQPQTINDLLNRDTNTRKRGRS